MARKQKLKKGDCVTHNGWVMFLIKDQYLFRNKPVVDVKDGEIVKIRVPVGEVVRYQIPTDEEVLAEEKQLIANGCAVNSTLTERGARYGDFTDYARLAQQLQDALRNHRRPSIPFEGFEHPWNQLSEVQKQALTIIADNLARILNGDPNYSDNWHDIQGCAKLVEDRLPK